MTDTTSGSSGRTAEPGWPDEPADPSRESWRIAVAGARGGQGATTVATVLAVLAAGHADTALVASRPDDVYALTATSPAALPGRGIELAPWLTLASAPLGWATPPATPVVVADVGRADDIATEFDLGGVWTRWLVVRGPCYTSLRVAVDAGWRADGVILLAEPGRAITAVDVADLLGVPVIAQVPVEPSVARVLDAGLLLARLPHLAPFRSLARLIQRHLASTPPTR
ncbi:MAG: hypothetical protein ACRD0A_15970 [Acidimicrobiales bacterium]